MQYSNSSIQKRIELQQQLGIMVKILEVEGLITDAHYMGPGIYVASPGPYGWSQVAREMVGGVGHSLAGWVLPLKSNGVLWKCGGGPMTGGIVTPKTYENARQSWEVVRSIIPASERGEPPSTVGACARRLIGYATQKQETRGANTEHLLYDGKTNDERNARYQYHDCVPGRYSQACMYDCTAYYYSLLQRLPSIRVCATSNSLLWQKMHPDEVSAWSDVLAAIGEVKPLRNSVWGVMLGSTKATTVWTKNKRTGKPETRSITFGHGPLRPAATVIARTAYEMCGIASAECGSVYSTVDSVTSIDGRVPKVWRDMGLKMRKHHEGESHIVGLGCWKVGPRYTVPYQTGVLGGPGQIILPRIDDAVPRPDLPERMLYKEWL